MHPAELECAAVGIFREEAGGRPADPGTEYGIRRAADSAPEGYQDGCNRAGGSKSHTQHPHGPSYPSNPPLRNTYLFPFPVLIRRLFRELRTP